MPLPGRIDRLPSVAPGLLVAVGAGLLVLANGCYADADGCTVDADCFRGEVCRTTSSNTDGTCLPARNSPDDASSPDDVDPETTDDATRPDTRTPQADTASPDTTECTPTDETCNGLDDDCDGRVDEDLTRECDNQTGVCEGATVACRDGEFPECGPEQYRAHAEAEGTNYEEVESTHYDDGRDNDCNGYTDEVFTDFDDAPRFDDPTCGIRRSDNSLLCWGKDDHPVVNQVPTGAFRDVALGNSFACGIRARGNITCWGDLNPAVADTPEGSSFVELRASGYRACARTSFGEVFCWGATEPGTEEGLDTRYDKIAVGRIDCGIEAADDIISCWNDRMGDTVPPTGEFQDVSVYRLSELRGVRICGVTTKGELECRTSTDEDVPSLELPSEFGYTAISVSKDYACALTVENRDLECWDHREGFDPPDRSGPFEAVDASETSVCVLDTDGRGYCYNPDGDQTWRPWP